jgi:hypothetical protein
MDRYYKVTVQIYGGPVEIIYTSRRFYSYSIYKFRNEAAYRGIKPASFNPEPLHDLEIIECLKIKERDYPLEWAIENLKNINDE